MHGEAALSARADVNELPPRPPAPPTFAAMTAIGIVAIASLGLHLWGIVGDLPYGVDADEGIFIRAAVRMLDLHTLNPRWFGNPGSTLIYPTAVLIEIWYQLALHLPFVTHPAEGIRAAFQADQMPFYMIGRLVSVSYDVGAVVATWLVARRLVGDAGGIFAAVFLPASALSVHYGQVVRTDSAGLFFALITVWLIYRAMARGRLLDWGLAAASIGLAISTRYFMVTLVVPYAIGAWQWQLRRSSPTSGDWKTKVPVTAVKALVLAPVTFALTSPFFFIAYHRAISDLRREAYGVHPGADGLSPLGNLAWYLTTMLPVAVGLASLALAAIGVVVLARSNRAGTAILFGYAVSYLIGISLSPLHWDRYVIPLIPVVGIFATAALLAAAATVARVIRSRPALRAGMAAIALFVVLVPGIAKVVAADRLLATPSTRVTATEWARVNLATARVSEEANCTYLGGTSDRFQRRTDMGRSLDDYRADGFDYILISSALWNRFTDATRYPIQHAFYQDLRDTGRLVASFAPGADGRGPQIDVYDIRAAP